MIFETLNTEILYRRTPSVFTEGRAERTSDKYQPISTIKIIDGLKNEGFMPTWASQCRSRNKANKAFTKHMVRFRHVNARPTNSGLYPEIVLVNSHDGLSSYRLMAGIYRMVCSNGLMAGDSYHEIRIRHQGDILGNVIEGTYEVIEEAKKMIASSDQMSSVILNTDEKNFFAEAAHRVRFDDSPIGKSFDAFKFNHPRRSSEINKNDLFTVFNVVQENMIKGGIKGYATDQKGHTKRVSTRAIKSIDQSNALNRALWTLAEKMMQVKRA